MILNCLKPPPVFQSPPTRPLPTGNTRPQRLRSQRGRCVGPGPGLVGASGNLQHLFYTFYILSFHFYIFWSTYDTVWSSFALPFPAQLWI